MQPYGVLVALSLGLLTATLVGLSARGFHRFRKVRARPQLLWGTGLALAAAATAVELVVYLGPESTILLQTYVFLSAAIVGVLSLACARSVSGARFEVGYAIYILITLAVTGVLAYGTPLSPVMVTAGVISGSPPLTLLVVSTLVTGPATVVLLAAVALSLRRSWRWQTVSMGAGACVLATGGALYIATFPVALYYTEFAGVVLIFLGLVSLPHSTGATSTLRGPVGEHS